MRLQRKLTNKEWKEIGEKYKDGGVHMYRGKLTYFYKGERQIELHSSEEIIYYGATGDSDHSEGERETWEVIIVLPGVKGIPPETFRDCMNVKTIIIHDDVKRIEREAFFGCRSLVFVKLSTDLEYIGVKAFYCCWSLTSIFIPPSCRQIGEYAFHGCQKLLIFHVSPRTRLGENVITDTALIKASGLKSRTYGDWIQNRQSEFPFPFHRLCCIEDPTFNQEHTNILTKRECCRQDDCGITPLIYLIYNSTVEYDIIEHIVKIGGKESLLIENKDGLNVLHWAYSLEDEAVIRLLVKIGGRELVDTLDFKRLSHVLNQYNRREKLSQLKTSSTIQSALLLHDYIYAIDNSKRNVDTLFTSKPTYRELIEIMGIQDIPDEHRQKLQQYMDLMSEQKLESFTENQEKVPLMRSTITVVGRGRDGKTSTINSLKGLPFQSYCESTKGAETSEVDLGIHVTSVDAGGSIGAAFERAQRDPYSTNRSIAMQLLETETESRLKTSALETDKSLQQASGFATIQETKTDSKCKQVLETETESRLKTRALETNKSLQQASGFATIQETKTISCIFKCMIPKCFRKRMHKKYNEVATRTKLITHRRKDAAKKKADIDWENVATLLQDEVTARSATKADPIIPVERNTAKKVAEIDLKNVSGKSVRFTIYDNGGQRVFRSIQSLLLSREGIFIVVFNIMRVLHEETQTEALEHLEYWLSSIKVDACKEGCDENVPSLIKYPPVILVGTHYDKFRACYESDWERRVSRLKSINEVLLQKLKIPLEDFAPLPNRFQESIAGESIDLCFWPIDNSNAQDTNIPKLRQLLLDATFNDPGFDISEGVPISMLNAMDKLTEISKDQPIISINRGEPSVMQVMANCGVFNQGIYDKKEKLELCKALLTKYHNIGHFLYFHEVHSLQDYCILDPQWLINTMTYVIRDFPYHWFPRDKRAINLNNGVSWKRLKDDCILDAPLLRQLWLGYDEHFEFLTNLMIEIGIFGKCNDIFTVPILRASENSDGSWQDKFSIHNEIGSISFGKHGFAVVPFYCRLVNSLVDDKCQPVILPSACFFRFESKQNTFARIFRFDSKRETFALWLNHAKSEVYIYSNGDKLERDQVLSMIDEKSGSLNSTFYKNQLDSKLKVNQDTTYLKPNLDALCQSLQSAEDIYRDKSSTKPKLNQVDYEEIVFNDLVTLLKKDFTAEKSKILVRNMLAAYSGLTIYSLRNLYHSQDEQTFKTETLEKGLAITNYFDREAIAKRMSIDFQVHPEPITILVACMENKKEDNSHFDREENIIKYMLAQSNYEALFLSPNGGFLAKNAFLRGSNEKILHFGTHKASMEGNTAYTGLLKDEDCKKRFDCIVLNSCKSEEITKMAKTHFRNKFIIYWDSRVEHEAAIRFSEQFYGYYCADGTRENPITFEEAVRKAKECMIQHNFLFEDPDKNGNTNDGKVFAGILKFHSKDTEEAFETSYGMNPSTVSPSNLSDSETKKKARRDSFTITTFEQSDSCSSRDIPNTNPLKKRKCNNDTAQNKSESDRLEPFGANVEDTAVRNDEAPGLNLTMNPTKANISQSTRNGDPQLERSQQELSATSQERESDDAGLKIDDLQSSIEPNRKVQNQNKTSQAMKNYRSMKCQLRCNYIFSKCKHTKESNCQYIIYKNQTERNGRPDKSIEHDIKECKERDKCRVRLTQCEKCGIYYCSKKKVPSEGSSVVDKSCLEVHVCSKGIKAKPDIAISMKERYCIDCDPLQMGNDCDKNMLDRLDLEGFMNTSKY